MAISDSFAVRRAVCTAFAFHEAIPKGCARESGLDRDPHGPQTQRRECKWVIPVYTPVRVTGTLDAAATDETVFVLDGEVRMISTWTLDAHEAVIDADASAGSTMTNRRHPLLGSVAQPVGNGAN
jgi:hypothetical protein